MNTPVITTATPQTTDAHTTRTALVTSIFHLLAAALLAVGLVLAAFTLRAGAAFTDKASAVQGCLEVARGVSITTGKSESSDWRVEDARLNNDVLAECLRQKGY